MVCKCKIRKMAILKKGALWRESASLIVLSKDKTLGSEYDYNVLLLSRSEKTSFMRNHYVFPGGVQESADESALWLKYLKKFGVKDKLINDLKLVNGPRPNIFISAGDNCIEREISLRISAIRETFEEVGILLCRKRQNYGDQDGFGQFVENFDRNAWQEAVHKNPDELLNLCKELDVIPDLWSLFEWSAWLTPASFDKRFETAFYLVALKERPNLIIDPNEAAEHLWKSPIDFLKAFRNEQIWLPPPQCYELSRLACISKLNNLKDFAHSRNVKGTTLFQPVQFKCNNGMVGVLPGDDKYPNHPNNITKFIETNQSVEEFRKKSKKIHRATYTGLYKATVELNFTPFNEHLTPINIDRESKL